MKQIINKITNNNTNKITNIVYFIFGFIILFFILYNIIFKYFFNNTFNYFYLTFMLIISLIIQISYLFRYIKLFHLEKIYKYINKIINMIYWKPLNTVYDFFKRIEGSGDFLYNIAKIFVVFCIFWGNNCIPILYYIFYLIPKIIIIIILTYTLFFMKIVSIYIYIFVPIIFIFLRILILLIYILNDFAVQNKKVLEYYLKIIKTKRTIQYELNLLTVKEPTKEKLKLYAERYSIFNSTEIFTSSFNYYKNNIMDPKFIPYTFSFFFVCSLKLLLISLNISIINNIYFFIIFFSFLLLELFNVRKNIKQQQQNENQNTH